MHPEKIDRMKLTVFFSPLLFIMCVGVLCSCAKDDDERSGAMGAFRINVEANAEVWSGEKLSAARAEEKSAVLPDVGDFALSVTNRGETVYQWDTYRDAQEDGELEIRPSTYTAKAWYGSLDAEGFEQPYYEGSADFQVRRGESTPVTVTCYLANSTLRIVYTDEFRQYFQEYSAAVSTASGHTVDFSQSEERPAYFTPGKLTVNAAVKKAGQANAAVYKVKEIDAKSRHAYTLTLDVDAGSATMKVSFSEEVSEEERVEFPVTDEALNAPAPYFKANGFVGGEAFNIIEGNVLDEKVYAYVNAVGGLVSCNLTTTSLYLVEKGFPASVNLAEPGEYADILEQCRLEVKGLSGNKDRMAMIDFTRLLALLPAGEVHTFVLSDATDLYGKTSGSERLELKVQVTPCDFTIASAGEQVAFLSQECKVRLSFVTDAPDYVGNPEKLSYYVGSGEEKTEMAYVGSETTDNKTFTVILRAKDDKKFVEPFEVTGSYNTYTHTTDKLDVGYGIWVAHEGDVWAKKVVFHLFNEEYDNINIQYLSGGTWHTLDNLEKMADYQPGLGTMVAAHGLPSNTTFRFRAVMNDGSNPTNDFEVTTEVELHIPNSKFEDWYDTMVWEHTIILSGGEKIYSFYPYTQNETDRWWSTLNDKTTQEQDGVASWYYCAYPGTMPTNATSMHTASWHWNTHGGLSLSQGAHKGNAAAEIATVGYGANNWYADQHDTDYRERGLLFVGTFDRNSQQQTLGHAFASRPQRVEFYYKFYSYNGETTKAYAKFYDKDNVEIGGGELRITQSIDTYTKGSFEIDYTMETAAAASMTLVFMSTDAESPATKDIGGDKGAWGDGYGDSRHVGSILTVDDVQLIYE